MLDIVYFVSVIHLSTARRRREKKASNCQIVFVFTTMQYTFTFRLGLFWMAKFDWNPIQNPMSKIQWKHKIYTQQQKKNEKRIITHTQQTIQRYGCFFPVSVFNLDSVKYLHINLIDYRSGAKERTRQRQRVIWQLQQPFVAKVTTHTCQRTNLNVSPFCIVQSITSSDYRFKWLIDCHRIALATCLAMFSFNNLLKSAIRIALRDNFESREHVAM